MKRSKERRHDEVVMEIKEEIGTQKTICREMEEEMITTLGKMSTYLHGLILSINTLYPLRNAIILIFTGEKTKV